MARFNALWAPMRLVLLSIDMNCFSSPDINRRIVILTEFVSSERASSTCTARIVKQIKMTPYLFSLVLPTVTSSGPRMVLICMLEWQNIGELFLQVNHPSLIVQLDFSFSCISGHFSKILQRVEYWVFNICVSIGFLCNVHLYIHVLGVLYFHLLQMQGLIFLSFSPASD